MGEACNTCIEISQRNAKHIIIFDRGVEFTRPLNRIQCEECGAFWDRTKTKTIQFHWSEYHKDWQQTGSWNNYQYIPMNCTQRRCMLHAKHKVAKKGKRKFKCDKHAGVCIIA